MGTDIEGWLRERGEVFLADIGIKEGQVVLDFGCRVGHYTIPSAKLIGEKGKVYAVDKDKESLNKLMLAAEKEGLKNIVPIHNQSEDLGIYLKDESADAALLYDVLHYMEVAERERIYEEIHRILKKRGLLSVYPKHNKLDEPLWSLSNMRFEDVIQEIERAKFRFDKKAYKELIHDDNYNMGDILNFTKP